MFSYFGSKSKIARLYPEPCYHLIIEPFAGSAAYSVLHHKSKEIWLNDLDPMIFDIWKWIKNASKEKVRQIPELRKSSIKSESVDMIDESLPQEVKNLMGLWAVEGSTKPSKKLTKWILPKGFRQRKQHLIQMHECIRKWKITNLNYEEMENIEATWFIDPPYQFMGETYNFNSKKIDFKRLGEWCRERKGQVIVCEGTATNIERPTWLPFRNLKTTKRLNQQWGKIELIWTNDKVTPSSKWAITGGFFE